MLLTRFSFLLQESLRGFVLWFPLIDILDNPAKQLAMLLLQQVHPYQLLLRSLLNKLKLFVLLLHLIASSELLPGSFCNSFITSTYESNSLYQNVLAKSIILKVHLINSQFKLFEVLISLSLNLLTDLKNYFQLFGQGIYSDILHFRLLKNIKGQGFMN